MYSNELVYKILKYIDENINNKITIDDIANNFNYNRYYIMKLFKKELNISIIDYINIIRIHNSLPYIKNNNSLLSTALLNGFSSLEYFSEMFKKVVSVNPRMYKKIINRNDIPDNILDKVIDRLTYIEEIINNINNYKTNIKPSIMPVKKFTIFK